MESVLGNRKGKSWAELHEDGSIVACDTVSLSCFIISLLSVSEGTRKMERGDPKMLLRYKLCS